MPVRFSLTTLVLLTTVAALSLVVWRQQQQLTPLREELSLYRQQLGYLSISKSELDKIHALQIESEHEHEWRYRVYLPEGRDYRIRFTLGTLPARTSELADWRDYLAEVGRSTSGSTRSWAPGEFVLSFRVKPYAQQDERENWVFEVRRIGEGSKGSTTLTVPWMSDHRAWGTSSSTVSRQKKTFEPDQPLRLLTVKRGFVTDTGSGYTVNDPGAAVTADGFMLWIEPSMDGSAR